MLILRVMAVIAALLVIVGILWDAFETVVLPRRVSRRFRLPRLYFRGTWRVWSRLARRLPAIERRENIMAVYGPLSLLALLALWVFLLIFAYALLLWGLGSPISIAGGETPTFGTCLYFSGTTLLTLGLGDVIPHGGIPRAIAVLEVGTGFGMLALVIGYLPVLYQAFSRREVRISLLDAHAGSPPSASALLLRHPPFRRARRLTALLADWEGWAAELLETHLSYPILAYYRSQHEDQSWVAALAMILDACALVLACGRDDVDGNEDDVQMALREQAAFTFATARHAAVDLAQVFSDQRSRQATTGERLPVAEHAHLRETLSAAGVGTGSNKGDGGVVARLDELRALYERYLEALAAYMLMDLPPWLPAPDAFDDWQTTADGVTAPAVAVLVSRQRATAPEHAGS